MVNQLVFKSMMILVAILEILGFRPLWRNLSYQVQEALMGAIVGTTVDHAVLGRPRGRWRRRRGRRCSQCNQTRWPNNGEGRKVGDRKWGNVISRPCSWSPRHYLQFLKYPPYLRWTTKEGKGRRWRRSCYLRGRS